MPRNDGLVTNLAGDFQPRYEPNFAWKSLISTTLALPGLRGAWCASNASEGGDMPDLTGQGRELSYQGDPEFGHENLISYVYYDGTGDYHDRADEAGLDIIGTETYIEAGSRGLTLGGWWYVEAFDLVEQAGLIAKWDIPTNGRSYSLYVRVPANECPGFAVSTDGINSVIVSGQAITVQTWFFAAGRFNPGTETDVWTGGILQGETASTFNQDTLAVGIPATLFNSDTSLDIAALDGAYCFDGKMAVCWLSAEMISDAIIRAYWEQTRAMFNR